MKELTWKSLLKKIFIFYICFAIFGLLLFIFLRTYSKNKFSESNLTALITGVSHFREITEDPCKYSILGDPVTAKKMYTKVNFYCPNGTYSNNSFDLRAVPDTQISEVIKEIGRIDGFKVTSTSSSMEFGNLKNLSLLNSWKCFVGTRKINDFSAKVSPTSIIDCFYGKSEQEILTIQYAKN